MPEAAADLSALALTPVDVILRLLCAMLIGGIVGVERENTHRPAGMRTHMLVALGACAVMLTAQAIFYTYRPYGATPDPARLPAQVITGVGFLGAGTILREGKSIKGLTTAASVWTIACLGVAAGAGFYIIAVGGAVMVVIILTVLEHIRQRFFVDRNEAYEFHLECEDVVTMVNYISSTADNLDAQVLTVKVDNGEGGRYLITFRLNFAGRYATERMKEFFSRLSTLKDALSVSYEQCVM